MIIIIIIDGHYYHFHHYKILQSAPVNLIFINYKIQSLSQIFYDNCQKMMKKKKKNQENYIKRTV